MESTWLLMVAMFKLSLYKTTDYPEFKKYITEAFHKKYILSDRRYLDWQYKNSLYLLKADGKIVGHFGFRDLRYRIGGRSKLVRVLINLFILEKFRTFGFGALLIKKVFDTALPVLVAGYRSPAMKVFKKYRQGWHEGILERYMVAINKVRPHTTPRIVVEKSRSFSREEINNWWKNLRTKFPVTIERDYRYLSWRFFHHPYFSYQVLAARDGNKLSGILIWRQDGKGKYQMGRIVDLVADKKYAEHLLDAFLLELKNQKIKLGEFLVSGNFYKKELETAGFFNVAGTKFEAYPVLLSPISFKRRNINIAHTLGSRFKDCYFTKAEGDQDRANPH